MIRTAADELWRLTARGAEVDPDALARAVELALTEPADFRTRLLIRDSIGALESSWGPARTREWLESFPDSSLLGPLLESTKDVPAADAFPSLKGRIMNSTKPDDLLVFLRELSTITNESVDIYIGGSIALILSGHLTRHTEDIDLVDEVPAPLRAHAQILDRLAQRHGLRLTHFQSHCLPERWRARVRSVGVFGSLRAFVVSEYDVFLRKLFSSRERDLDDLRALASQLERDRIVRMLHDDAKSLLGETKLRQAAEKNWFVVYGDAFPAA